MLPYSVGVTSSRCPKLTRYGGGRIKRFFFDENLFDIFPDK